MATGQMSYRDNSNEVSNIAVYLPDVAAGGANFDTVVAALTAINAAIAACSLCEPAAETLRQDTDTPSSTVPASPWAQRELAIRVFYSDDVNGKRYHLSIPGPDLDTVEVLAGTDSVVLTDSPFSAFITAFEAGAVSPDGNAVTVDSARLVGRRS
jgi:hypothetical protein